MEARRNSGRRLLPRWKPLHKLMPKRATSNRSVIFKNRPRAHVEDSASDKHSASSASPTHLDSSFESYKSASEGHISIFSVGDENDSTIVDHLEFSRETGGTTSENRDAHKVGPLRSAWNAAWDEMEDEEGTEVVLFANEKKDELKIIKDAAVEVEGDEVFLSLGAYGFHSTPAMSAPSPPVPMENTREPTMKELPAPSPLVSITTIDDEDNDSPKNPTSTDQASSLTSPSDTFTWVSHDEDCEVADDRPVREISFASPPSTPTRLTPPRPTPMDIQLERPLDRDAIFATLLNEPTDDPFAAWPCTSEQEASLSLPTLDGLMQLTAQEEMDPSRRSRSLEPLHQPWTSVDVQRTQSDAPRKCTTEMEISLPALMDQVSGTCDVTGDDESQSLDELLEELEREEAEEHTSAMASLQAVEAPAVYAPPQRFEGFEDPIKPQGAKRVSSFMSEDSSTIASGSVYSYAVQSETSGEDDASYSPHLFGKDDIFRDLPFLVKSVEDLAREGSNVVMKMLSKMQQ